jgi:vanadium-dependent haloperoxidase-like protein
MSRISNGSHAVPARYRMVGPLLVALAVVVAIGGATSRSAKAVLDPTLPNTVQQWNKIAEDTVVSSGAFQGEGYVYMTYTSAAVYDAVVAIQGGYQPYGPAIAAPAAASVDAAVVEAAYRTLSTYFSSSCNPANLTCMGLGASLLSDYNAAMALIPGGTAKTNGMTVGAAAAAGIVALRNGDGRLTPIATTSPFEKKDPGPGVWRLTPTAYAAPQTPWLGSVQPFLLKSPGQFKTEPPVPLTSQAWVRAFDEVKAYGKSDSALRTGEQTATAYFYTTNVIRQFNRAARDLATAKNLGLLQTARLFAMVNAVGADALMSTLNQKYHFLFWRPVTAIDPTSVTTDGFGPSPTGFDDGNPATVEQTGWRPLLPTPNHPEYPSAHGTITSGMAEVFSEFLGTDQIDLDIRGSTDATGNLVAVRHFDTADELRADVVNARTWGGLHYRFSTEAGVQLGQKVAHYGLNHTFKATG